MKRSLVFVTALLLALPNIGFAGSSTSRWDMIIGGFVKFDLVYADKAVGTDNRVSPVDSKGGNDRDGDSTGNLTWSGAETRLNWLVKGPDAWGAKTSAFVEGDFRAASSTRGTTNQGEFGLRHAYMQLAWPDTKLLIGHTWQAWGLIPSQNRLAVSEQHFMRGTTRMPQIRLTQNFTKNFTVVAAVEAPYDVLTTNNVGNDPRANSLWPDVTLDFSYASNACGKIGPFGLKIGVGGFYGKDKYENRPTGSAKIDDETLDRYGASLYWYVPIIPEKKEGDKAMALGFTGTLFAGKGMATYLNGYTQKPSSITNYNTFTSFPGAYNRGRTSAGLTDQLITNNPSDFQTFDPAYYTTNGGWIQGTFYFTDRLSANAIYGAEFNNISRHFKASQTTSTSASGIAVPERIQNLTVNLMYDVSQAIRFGIEYDYVTTAYAYRETTTRANNGSFNSVRVGAMYFF